MGWQIAMSALVVFVLLFVLDTANDGLPKYLKAIGGLCIFIVPIGLIIQIWQ
jgi:hypothetical protein